MNFYSDLEVLKEADLSSTELSHANKDEPIENLCPSKSITLKWWWYSSYDVIKLLLLAKINLILIAWTIFLIWVFQYNVFICPMWPDSFVTCS